MPQRANNSVDFDHLGEKCAVFAIFGRNLDVSRLTFFGLFGLQHRGQESSGIASTDGEQMFSHRGMGLVTQVFDEEGIKKLGGHIAIGHNRYSTSKGSHVKHAQPVISQNGLVALAHNGNLPSISALQDFLKSRNMPTEGMSDSEMMTEAISYYSAQGLPLGDAVKLAWPLFTGAFSIVVMDKTTLVAARDVCGIRPLSMARLNGGFAFSSETCALKPIGASHFAEVVPGTLVIVDDSGMRTEQIVPPNQKLDIFEFVYFSRPDSNLLGKSVYKVRQNFGKQLAKEYKVDADIVVPVPDTAVPAATGYAQVAGIPLEMALVKNRYIHRTFIEPEQHLREQGVRMKLTALPEILRGKRVVLIDDSIVRGTTSKQIVNILFEAGAKEVHFLVSSPPVRFPDFYGIDVPDQNKLIGFTKSVEEIRDFIGATTLHYLTYEGMIAATGLPENVFCTTMFNGVYPVDIKERKEDVKYAQIAQTLT